MEGRHAEMLNGYIEENVGRKWCCCVVLDDQSSTAYATGAI